MKRVLIIGANSAIAVACARLWAKEGATFFLVGRDASRLAQTGDDLLGRGAKGCGSYQLDVQDFSCHVQMLEQCVEFLGQIDVALIAHGTLPDQQVCEGSAVDTVREISINATSIIALLTILAERFETQHCGTMAVISSVAGDRGRPSNYVYGAAKAAVSTFCAGLRARMYKVGVNVLTIKPGFVKTPMTQQLKLPALLVAEPDTVAKRILNAIERKVGVVYTPGFWCYIMMIIRSIPDFVFKRLSI